MNLKPSVKKHNLHGRADLCQAMGRISFTTGKQCAAREDTDHLRVTLDMLKL